ncbi:FAD-binding protein [candidate division KSB3 bacterium]|uniref:FAD-binding protein n=1 Tax=candidate division KSB3 bacterium TaxID=2044937 RepID=A0A9D5JX39_9BACT|nr:FAD-binding protein [candidate division KSB3 bacterium]MBD3325914.1 FAD-binding protein [candidate division KSB3 bacterium]
MTAYQHVTPALVEELEQIVGSRNVIYSDPEQLEGYSHDEVADTHYAHLPEVVVKPATAEEISAIMKLANRAMVPVTPRGAGSGLSGGAVPVFGGIVLSVERMNNILEIDTGNMMITVEAGVVTNQINAVLEEYGLFYAGYPMSLETCFIGGNVAENAGGGKAIKYGVTDRYVHGLEVVLPTGEILQFGGKRVKDVTGYNLLRLMVGSEGTLGIFSKVTLKLLPIPKVTVDLLVLFEQVQAAMDIVPVIMTETGVIPTAIEFMDKLSVQTSCRYLNEHLPYEHAGAMLLIELDGSSEAQLESQYEAIGELCLARGAMEVYVADNHTTQERVWKVRRSIAEAFKVYSPIQSTEDIVVPFAQIPQLLQEVDRLARKYGVIIPNFGHAGDGNLHATPIKPPEMPLEQWQQIFPALSADLYRLTAQLGGTISGEHGIGSKRKEFLSLVMAPELIALMRRVKQTFDPNNILNPGKIFPDAEVLTKKLDKMPGHSTQ